MPDHAAWRTQRELKCPWPANPSLRHQFQRIKPRNPDRRLYVAGLLRRWLSSDVRAAEQGEALAAGVAWLHKKWTGEAAEEPASSGVQVLRSNGAPVTIVWASDNSHATAFIAGPRFLETHWMALLQKAASPAQVYLAGVGTAPPPEAIIGDSTCLLAFYLLLHDVRSAEVMGRITE
jgi:hypothetical protein